MSMWPTEGLHPASALAGDAISINKAGNEATLAHATS